MSVWQALILGAVQGIAEFLPISSSGHLVIMQSFFGLKDVPMLFDILLHVGTLVSVFLIFWHDIRKMVIEFFSFLKEIFSGKKLNINKTPERRLIFLLLTATLPLFVAVMFNDKIESAFSSPLLVGFMLLITGTILLLTDRLAGGKKNAGSATYKNAFMVGIFQLVAILPGISRSGSTIYAGLRSGFKREFAVKFSLLLSVIAILGATLSSLNGSAAETATVVGVWPCLVGMISAAIFGVVSIKFLVSALKNGKYFYFSVYCYSAGIITIIACMLR